MYQSWTDHVINNHKQLIKNNCESNVNKNVLFLKMCQNFAGDWLVPLSVLFSLQNELLPNNFSENLKILEIFVIGPHALPQCMDKSWKNEKSINKSGTIYEQVTDLSNSRATWK